MCIMYQQEMDYRVEIISPVTIMSLLMAAVLKIMSSDRVLRRVKSAFYPTIYHVLDIYYLMRQELQLMVGWVIITSPQTIRSLIIFLHMIPTEILSAFSIHDSVF